MATVSMNEAEKSEYCRKQGLFTSDIECWHYDCLAGCAEKKAEKLSKKLKSYTAIPFRLLINWGGCIRL